MSRPCSKWDSMSLHTKKLRGYLDFQFLSRITQNWWIPRLSNVFGFVFNIFFHHSIFWFLSNELWKLKTHFRCFQVMENWVMWHFCNFTQQQWDPLMPCLINLTSWACSLPLSVSHFSFSFSFFKHTALISFLHRTFTNPYLTATWASYATSTDP